MNPSNAPLEASTIGFAIGVHSIEALDGENKALVLERGLYGS